MPLAANSDTDERRPSAGFHREPTPGRRLRDLLFFLLFYLYFWRYVDTRLLYHGAGVITDFPAFYRGWGFFTPFLSHPGGPVDYLSAFLSQLFYYSWLGALVVTLQAWLLCACMDHLLRAVTRSLTPGLRFLLPVLLLVPYTRYACHLPTTMALATALLVSCLYSSVSRSRIAPAYRLCAHLLLSALLYVLAGGALLLFAVVCAIHDLLLHFRWKTGLFQILSALAISYLLGLLVFRVSILDAFSNSLPVSWKTISYPARSREVTSIYLLYLCVPSTLLASGLLRALRHRARLATGRVVTELGDASPGRLSRLSARAGRLPRPLAWVLASLLTIAVAAGVAFCSRDDHLRTRFQVDYFASHEMWPELLASARNTSDDALIAHEVNRALYHLGMLGDAMFAWPQRPDHLLLSDREYMWTYWCTFDVLLELGLLNNAEHALTECLQAFGDRPIILQRLALIHMAKGNTGSARIYLGALSKTLFQADWATRYLERLDADPDLSGDPYIQELRSRRLDRDCPMSALTDRQALLWLLARNSRNRMAFEYLIARDLLNKDLNDLVQDLKLLRGFRCPALPRHFEEAALIYMYRTGTPVQALGYLPSPVRRAQIEEFTGILDRHGGDLRAAFDELSKRFGDSYLLYYTYAPMGPSE